MKQLSKEILIYGDCDYTHAVNYQHMYNAPITLNYGEKHNRKKYIISAGTSDHITLLQDGVFIYVISENTGLQYISLSIINTETFQVEDNVFLNSEDCTTEENFCFGILDMDAEAQLKVLFEYCG